MSLTDTKRHDASDASDAQFCTAISDQQHKDPVSKYSGIMGLGS